MPFKIVADQQRFTFETTPDGLPVAHITRWGNGVWLKCCPLCGMLHEVLKGQTTGEFEPNCILKVTHPKVFAAWQTRFPASAQYSRVMLTNVDTSDLRKPDISPNENLRKPDIQPSSVKQKRSRHKVA